MTLQHLGGEGALPLGRSLTSRTLYNCGEFGQENFQ